MKQISLNPADAAVRQTLLGGDVWLDVRGVTRTKQRELRKSVGLPAWPPDGERLTDEKRMALELATLDWMIEGWGGVVGDDGQPAPLTPQAKLEFVDRVPGVADLLPQWARIAQAQGMVSEATALGN